MTKLNDALKEKTKSKIITFLMRGNASYSDIMHKLDEKDSGKVNFHLKSLLELGLITKEDTLYSLTQEGERFGMYAKQFELKEQYPIPVVCCKVTRNDGKILMAKRAKKPAIDHWVVPGGKVDHGESIFECCKREVLEECGIEIEPKSVSGIFPTLFNNDSTTTHHIYLIVVEADFVKQLPHSFDPDSDVKEFDWFTLDEIKNELKLIESNRIFFDISRENPQIIKEQSYEM